MALDLTRPARGAAGWDSSLNTNFSEIESWADGIDDDVDDLQAEVTDLADIRSLVTNAPEVFAYEDTFNGPTGTVITLPRVVTDTDEYTVSIAPTSRAGAIGDISVEQGTTELTVKCSESNTTDTFILSIYYPRSILTGSSSGYKFIGPVTIGKTVYCGTETALVAAQSNPFIDCVVTTSGISITDDSALTKPIYVNPGCIIATGSYTLSGVQLLSTGAYQQFDVSGGGGVRFAADSVVMPEWFGGAPYVNDDYYSGTGNSTVLHGILDAMDSSSNTIAINAAAASATNGTLKISKGFWPVDAAISVPSSANLIMEGMIVYMGTANITVLTIGDSSSYILQRHIEINVACGQNHAGTWASEDFVGAKIINAYNSDIKIVAAGDQLVSGAKGFTIGSQMVGDTKGSYYNRIELFKVAENKIGLDLKGVGTGGYFNENKFIGGNFRCSALTNPTLDRTAIRLAGEHNVFDKPAFEHGGSSVTGVVTCVDINGARNIVLNARDEINQAGYLAVIQAGDTNYDNYVEFQEGGGNGLLGRNYIDNTNLKRNTILRRNRSYAWKEMRQLVYGVKNIGRRVGGYTATTAQWQRFPGMSFLTSDGLQNYLPRRAVVYPNHSVQNIGGATNFAGFFAYTDNAKNFVIHADWDASKGDGLIDRIVIVCYDADGSPLTGTSPQYVMRNRDFLGGREFVSYTLGGVTGYISYNHWTESQFPYEFHVHDNVKKIFVAVGLKNAGAALRSLELYTHRSDEYGMSSMASGYGGGPDDFNHYNSVIPIKGIYSAGDVIYNDEPASSEAAFWVAASSGAAYRATRSDGLGVYQSTWYKWSTGDTVWEALSVNGSLTGTGAPDITGKSIGDTVVDGAVTWRKVWDTSTTMVAGPALP